MKNKTTIKAVRVNNNPKKQAFFEHIQELRRRLSWIALIFIVASAAAYPFYHDIMDVLFAPLNGRELVYLTPIGGFSFIIKVCSYVGIIVAIPAIIYHGYKFLQPTMKRQPRAAKRFLLMSVFLALCGISFAYYVLLPAALRFLTTLDIQQVTAMLTVDSYLNFVIAYVIGAALLFQIPVIMLLINNINKIPPGAMMKYQRHVILGAFIVAAILSPTPDVINQSLMAAPVVVMYQVAIVLVLIVNRYRKTKSIEETFFVPQIANAELELVNKITHHQQAPMPNPAVAASSQYTKRTIDGFSRPPKRQIQRRPVNLEPKRASNYRTIDGFFVTRQELNT
jgi:sec-independent protein translocase protein TatC